MVDDRVVRRNKLREALAQLKSTALAELERHGYNVRGKTPAQIRRLLRGRPSTLKSNVAGTPEPDA
jgi:DNA-binding GntR family transcriptional regulator